MHNMSLPREIHFPIDEISSPLGAQLKFSESDLFPETLQNSEVASISSDYNNFNNCSYEEEDSTYNNNNLSNITMDDNMNNNYNNTPSLDHHDTITTISALFFEDDDQLGNNASTDFTSSYPSFSLPQHRQHSNNNNYYDNNNNEEILFTMPLMQYNYNNVEISLGDETYNIPEVQPVEAVEDPLILTGYNTEESGFMSSLTNDNNNIGVMSSNIDPMISIGNYLPFSFDVNDLFLGVHNQELEFQGDNNIDGTFHPHLPMVRVFNYPATHLQAVSSERQHQHQLVDGSPMASEISDHNELKVGKLSVEERKRKIHRYLKKRNQRNFSKKIKYACRKMLADSRPRVRGRFAKNDEIARTSTCNNHEDDTHEDGSCLFSNPTFHPQQEIVKAEEELESSHIFAHISGVNSFKCNYPIQSWI